MGSFVSHLSCPRCGRTHDHRVPQNLCTCGSPLLVEYDLEAVRRESDRRELAGRRADMWRYRELLPVEDIGQIRRLGEGWTPMIPAAELGARIGLSDLWVKDESRNPTGTFKARGAACGIARARELGIREVCLPTAGNAGGAWAAYGAADGVRVHVAMPADAPETNQVEVEVLGATLELVDGLISDAARVVRSWVAERGWFDVSTFVEPYRVEGKKTMGLEIAEQLDWRPPDVIVYPAGGGVGLIGIWRAMEQLRDLGWVEEPLPRLVAVQAAGCAPIVRAFERGTEEVEWWEGVRTVAAGLRVPAPKGGDMVLRAIRESKGTAIAVEDREILSAVGELARATGIFPAPEGAATLAAARRLREEGFLERDERVVLINTGTGMKYPEVLRLVAE